VLTLQNPSDGDSPTVENGTEFGSTERAKKDGRRGREGGSNRESNYPAKKKGE